MAHRKQDQVIKPLSEIAGIYGTLSAIYGAEYKAYTARHFPIVINATRYLRTVLKIKGTEKVIFKPIKGKTTGLHYGNTGNIFVDMRQSTLKVVETIAHELIHAEQFNTGRLVRPGGVPFSLWEGNPYNSSPRTYEEYRALPWEKEAFERSPELARKAMGL